MIVPFKSIVHQAEFSDVVLEGVAWLQAGILVTKHGWQGKPHECRLRLSSDKGHLLWETTGVSKLVKTNADRILDVSAILEVLVGRESEVFRRQNTAVSPRTEHLSVSLLMRAALPTPPEAMHDDDNGDQPGGGSTSRGWTGRTSVARETLDLTFANEEETGLVTPGFHPHTLPR